MLLQEEDETLHTALPFFADGYPGLMYQQTTNGLLVNPHNKQMPKLFLYGQTINPIELVMNGAYNLVVFQLYPFVLQSFFSVKPADVNNGCYNLDQLPANAGHSIIKRLENAADNGGRIDILTDFLYNVFKEKKQLLDFTVKQAMQLIIDNKGQASITDICNQLHLTERTFERRFIAAVGVPAKQFAKMIQFQLSLEQITVRDYSKLTDIVYNNGFADQSHFIKVFKAFTGKTPKKFVQSAG